MVANHLVCKNIFLTQRVFGFSICYNTRSGGNNDSGCSFVHQPMAENSPSIIDDDDQTNDQTLAIFTEQIKSFSACLDKATYLSHETRKAIRD